MSAYEDDGGAVLFSPGDGGSSVGGWVGSGGICGGGYNKANVEAFCEQTVYRVALSANQLMEQAEAYSDGFDSLAAELHGITQALGGVMDAFSGPSIATRVMRDGGDVGGGQASRRSLRGQRKPGAQLLWPGPEEGGMVQFAGDAGSGTARGFEEEEEEVVEEVAELAGDDLNLHLEGKGPVQGVQDELYGSSILVEMSDQENGNDVAPVVYGGLSKDRKDLDTTASGAASRAVTRPQTTVDDVANREDREGSAEAGQMRHGAPPQDDDDAEPTSADVASPSHHVGAITAKGGGVSEATSTSPTSDAVSESELAEYQAAKVQFLLPCTQKPPLREQAPEMPCLPRPAGRAAELDQTTRVRFAGRKAHPRSLWSPKSGGNVLHEFSPAGSLPVPTVSSICALLGARPREARTS